MDDIVPRVLAFMSTVELMFVQQVCRSWQRHTAAARSSLIHRLHLGQFWSRVGVLPDSCFTAIAAQFGAVVDLNLAYCSFLTGPTLLQIVRALPQPSRLTKLNLFYCHLLTDDDIEQLLGAKAEQEQLPLLRDLNLGRCNRLTERTVRLLCARAPRLQTLNLCHNPAVGEETLMLMDDLSNFPSLTLLNVMHCARLRMDEIDELLKAAQAQGRNAKLHKQGLPSLRVIGPQELFQIDKSGKKMRKDIDADT